MRDDERMSSQVGFTRNSANDRLAGATDQLLMHRTRSEEENRPRGGNGRDDTSATAVCSTSSSNGFSNKELNAQSLESASAAASSSLCAPPSTPSPHYGFRRKTTNAMVAGRRVPNRSPSAPGLGGDSRGGEQGGLSSTADVVQRPSPRRSGSSAVDTERHYSNEATSRLQEDARRSGGLSSSTAPGTLPNSNGHTFKYSTLRKYGGERIFQMNDDEVAAALLGDAPSAGVEVDRRTGYRYPVQGSKIRSGSVPTVVEAGSSSPLQLFPRSGGLDPATPATAVASRTAAEPAPEAAEPKPRREKRSEKEERRRRRHSSRRSGKSASGASRGGNSKAVSEPMASSSSAWFAGMTAAQQARFESLQEHSSGGRELARWKMLELMRHWMSAQGTRSKVDAVIYDVLVDAGLAKVKGPRGSVSGEAGDPGPCSSPPSNPSREDEGAAAARTTVRAAAADAVVVSPPTPVPPPENVSPRNQLVAKTIMPGLSDAAAPPAEAQETPTAQKALGNTEEAIAKEKTPLPALEGKVSTASSPVRALVEGAVDNEGCAPTSPTAEMTSPAPPVNYTPATSATQLPISPRRHQFKNDTAAAPTAKEEGQQQTSPAAQGAHTKNGGGPSVKTAEKGEGNAPLNATPEKQVAPTVHGGSGALSETATLPFKTDDSQAKINPAKPISESTTPQHTPSESSLRSPLVHDKAMWRGRSRSNSLKGAAKRRAATYDEIPRFYFPVGQPITSGQVISGPLSKKHENPHLKVVDGVAIAAPMYDGEESGVLCANAEALVSGGGDDAAIPSEARCGPKVAPMSELHLLEDKHVTQYIQREFSRLPPFPKHSSRVRLLSGRVRNSSHHHHMPYAKQELLYKQQFIQCVQRICSQCFGVPNYFAFIVLRLIQWMVNNAAANASEDESHSRIGRSSSGRMGSSSPLLCHNTNGSGSSTGLGNTLPSFFHITPQQLKDFHDEHLKNKDAVRRVFDLLILSSHLPNSSAASASVATSNAVVATEVADELADALTPRSPDAALLRPYLLPQDFVAYIDVLLTQHPGLAFLRQTPDFQTKYLDTVIYRIYYELDRFDRGRIRYSEFSASRLMDAFRQVDAADDINSVLLFFSYEHFYVLYCRFWELDEDRDMQLTPEDLMRYTPEDVMNPIIVQRVFSGVCRRLRCTTPQRMGYEDFVWFCLSEEDKATPQAIRYWFRVLDLDGDGVLSVYELREFYDATRDRIAQYVQEGLATFEDVVCQVFDMMRCPEYRGLYLSDLLREPEAAAVALNMLTNVVKFLQFEQRDPFVAHQERLLGGLEQSTWDRFARLEYDRMALETDEEG
ncbi:hypothetical protein ABL78_4519 [Leptomonas seymouri]|uniref:EF-hand domain-containing protein n=1 Tax=Leptomonas seymouri TaxID=5684 RepID=A0A0N1HY31_LEPSE|nr:hypothetical protein ABL78_4519 [Leptomonas seymouri]|eukprot:KPI86403.1 hypothetical protein ABL78_4519 [Leptomonas seymouri]